MSNSSHSRFDLMLCGGGVVGLSIAFECASRGWKVLVVDAGSIGMEASWAGAGILPAGATKPALDPIEQLLIGLQRAGRIDRTLMVRLQARYLRETSR